MQEEFNPEQTNINLHIYSVIKRLNELYFPAWFFEKVEISIFKENRTNEQLVKEPQIRVEYKNKSKVICGKCVYSFAYIECMGGGSFSMMHLPHTEELIKENIRNIMKLIEEEE